MSDGLVEQIQHSDGSWVQLDGPTVVHVLRNPGGWADEAVRACRLWAANCVEREDRSLNTPPFVSTQALALARLQGMEEEREACAIMADVHGYPELRDAIRSRTSGKGD